MMASWKVGPALAAGNTAILKPASYSPLTAIRLAELALEAGLPPGVLNVVTGPGPVGRRRRWPPTRGIGKIAFTGETATGQEILRAAAATVKKVSLELGGKSPNIVFADADLEAFAAASPYAVFDNCGQDCCARSRILVERSVHERVVELFAAATERVKVGDPSDPATEVGPLVSFRQRERVEGYVESGLEEGATLVTGGVRPADPALADGAYLLPAVFDRVAPVMRIAREEVFGPVVGIIPFDTDEEALAHRQRVALRPVGVDLEPRHRPGAAGGEGAQVGRRLGQLQQQRPRRGAVRRLQAVGDRQGPRAPRRSSSTPSSRTSSSTSADAGG